MELWIRSQDRHKLELVSNRFLVQETTINPHSHWFGIMVDGSYLAEYNSEERALEILDEIQEYLERECRKEEIDFEMNGVQHSSMRYAIYEMPKE